RLYLGQGLLAGRVNAVAYDQSHPGTYYAGSGRGGLWKSTDFGAHWMPISDGWAATEVSCITIDPTNSSVIYAGTGDYDGYAAYGFGIMKSTNGGATWTNLGKAELGGFNISAILVDPENPSIVTVTMGRGPNWWGPI